MKLFRAKGDSAFAPMNALKIACPFGGRIRPKNATARGEENKAKSTRNKTTRNGDYPKSLTRPDPSQRSLISWVRKHLRHQE